MKRFLILSRAPFFTAIVTPMLLGIALAYRENGGSLSWLRLALTFIGLVFAHAGANLLNDYYDFRNGADINNPNRNQFSGGSPHIVNGIEKPKTFFAFATTSCAIAAASGLSLMWLVDHGIGPVFYLALAGFALALLYTAPPLKLAYKGFGEIAVFLAFGPLPALGSYYVQTNRLDFFPVIVSLPLSFLITNIIWINEFPDYDSDKQAGKNNMVVLLGREKARYVYHGLAIGAFALIAVLGITPLLGAWGLIGLIGLPPALMAIKMLNSRFADPKSLVPAQGLTILAHLLTGILLCVGIFIGGR